MISVNIGDILDNKIEVDISQYKIYIIRDNDEILYVGKASTYDISHRIRHHMGLIPHGSGPSKTGEVINDNLPDSRLWQVDMLSLKECAIYLKSFPPESHGARKDPIVAAEESTIRFLKPYLNIVFLNKEERRHLPPRYGKDPWKHRKV